MSLGPVDVLEPGIAVGVHPASVTCEMILGVLALPIGREAIPAGGRGIAAPGSLVPPVCPQPRRCGLPGAGVPASSPGCHPRRSPVRPAHAARWHRRAVPEAPWTCRPSRPTSSGRGRAPRARRSGSGDIAVDGRRNLETRTCASRPGPGRPRSIGRDGRGACVKVSQPEQAMRGRTMRFTMNRPGTYSSSSVHIPRRGGEGFRRSAHSPRRRWSVRSPGAGYDRGWDGASACPSPLRRAAAASRSSLAIDISVVSERQLKLPRWSPTNVPKRWLR